MKIGLGIGIPKRNNAGIAFPDTIEDALDREIVREFGITEEEYNANKVSSVMPIRLESDLGITTSGSNVTGWQDQAGSGVTLTPSVGNPLYAQEQLNGFDVVTFSENSVFVTPSNVYTAGDSFTQVFVSKSPIDGAAAVTEIGFNSNNLSVIYPQDTAGGYRVFHRANSVGGNIIDEDDITFVDVWHITIAVLDSAAGTYSIYRNSSEVAEVPSIAALPVNCRFSVGGRIGGTALFGGEIAAAYLFNVALNTPAKRDIAESYLATKYGITLA